MKIHITSIPHSEQRYDTSGDYFVDKEGITQVRVDQSTDEREMFLIAIHELIEAFIAKHRGISWQKIDKFDIEYRGKGEPGDNPKSPYYKEHQFASIIEHLVANELDVNWDKYMKETEK